MVRQLINIAMVISKLDVKFNIDWQPLIDIYEETRALVTGPQAPTPRWIDGWDEYMYEFREDGEYSNFVFLNEVADHKSNVGLLTKGRVERLLPWCNKLREDMRELNIYGISIQGSIGNVAAHRDIDDSSSRHCKMNYIITQCDVKTYADNDGVIESYPSTKDTGWLLDTTKLHWVEGQGQRYVFQIFFHSPYERVLEWFKLHPNLVYGA